MFIRDIDLEYIKSRVTPEEIEALSEEDFFAFWGSQEYFNTFNSKKKTLSKKEEIKLGKILEQYKMGDDSINAQVVVAYNKLFKYNTVKVYRQVWSFFKLDKAYGYDIEGAKQDGLMELHRGIINYDTSKDCGLYTRVYYLVEKKLSVQSNLSKSIALTSTGGWKAYRVKQIIEDYKEENDITPSNEYIKNEAKERYNINISDIELISLSSVIDGVIPLDKVAYENETTITTIGDMQGYTPKEFDLIEYNDTINMLTKDLEDNDRELLLFFYGINSRYNDYTEKELAEEMGISVKKLKSIVEKILDKVRKTAEEKGIIR